MSGHGALSYRVDLTWQGNRGTGTSDYRVYSREYVIAGPGKPVLAGSADPAFLGESVQYNPEEMLVAAPLSACRMLWYLHLCADAGGRRHGLRGRCQRRHGSGRRRPSVHRGGLRTAGRSDPRAPTVSGPWRCTGRPMRAVSSPAR